MKKNYQEIIFLQGSEAEEALNILEEQGEEKVVSYLSQWDYGDSPVTDEKPWGTSDVVAFVDGYILTYNRSLGYIGLCKEEDQ